jgi:ankyrin repeat protein
LNHLQRLLSEPAVKGRVKMIITSRPHIYVDRHPPLINVVQLSLTAEDSKSDIEAFVESRVQTLFTGIVDEKVRRALGDEVRQALIGGANGMFLWASLILKELETATDTSPRAVRKTLKTLPPDLPGVYLNILSKIQPRDQETAESILRWVTWAMRPLTLEELTIAIAIQPEHTSMSTMEDLLQTDLRKVLRLVFGPMLRIEDNTVHLVHQSAKDFLVAELSEVVGDGSQGPHQSFFRLSRTQCNQQIALSCLTYLSFDECDVGPGLWNPDSLQSYDDPETARRFVDHGPETEMPFLNYAAIHWPEHTRSTDQKNGMHQMLRSAFQKLAESPRKINRTYKFLLESGSFFTARGLRFKETEPLQIAASLGFREFVEDLLKAGADPNTQGGTVGNALQAAAYRGYEAIVRLLLENGADANAQGGEFGNALQAAAYKGNEAIVRLLLENGADVNAQGGHFGNALLAAAYKGNEAIVRLLLENGADANAQGGEFGNALQAAAYKGNEAIVRLLLENGADVNAQGGQYGNALQAAAYWDKEAIVRLLLENGADVNSQGGYFGNALQAAAYKGNEAIVRLLLENGADVNSQGGEYGNALLAAVSGGKEAVVHLLLENGADVNAQGGEFGNALQAAAYKGKEPIVRLLLENGADVNAQGGRFGNALQAAAYEGKEPIVRLLLEKGADLNAQGGEYGNALLAAVSGGKEAVVHLLLELGADVNAQGGYFGNALQAAANMGNEAIVRLLLENGADVNAQGGEYGNALLAAAYTGNEAIVRLLLENGADVNAQGGEYGNALQAAAKNRHPDVVGSLIDHGSGIKKTPIKRRSALHLAHSTINMMEMLLQEGADISARDEFGRTPLFFSRAASCEETIKLLLDNGADENHRDQFGRTARDVAVGTSAVAGLLPDEPMPRCKWLVRQNVKNIARQLRCDICQNSVMDGFYYRKLHSSVLPSLPLHATRFVLSIFTSKTKDTTDCCDCSDDDYDMCISCFSAGNRCKGNDHQLKERFLGGGMQSFSELSPLVKEMKLPNSKNMAGSEGLVEVGSAERLGHNDSRRD